MNIKTKRRKEVLTFLKKNNLASIALVSGKNKPMVSLVYFAIDDDFNLYFTTREKCRKFRELGSKKKAAFVVTNSNKSICVQMEGEVTEIKNRKLNSKPIKLLTRALEQGFFRLSPVLLMNDGESCHF